MAKDEKEKAAERLIDEFAAQLLALNDRQAIPEHWNSRLRMALTPLPRKRGTKPDDARSIEIVRALLTEFVAQLRRLSFPRSPISIDLANFVADALDRYLRGDEKRLDAAFGLTPKRGRPGDPKKKEGIARTIFAMRLQGQSWYRITDAIAEQDGSVTDQRTLQRVYEEFAVRLMAEEIVKRLRLGIDA